jgi:hypothetical protein
MKRAADPRFTRLGVLLRDAQLAGAVQVRIDRPTAGGETSLIVFGPSQDPALLAKQREIRTLLGLRTDVRELRVYYGGFSGKDDEIAMTTRSMLQVMLELAAIVQVPEADVAEGRAATGLVETPTGAAPGQAPITITMLSGDAKPADAFVAVQYGGRWFWIPDTDIRSKYTFSFVMLMFSISETGIRGSAPVVTVPASP